jgi:hypothetical protein
MEHCASITKNSSLRTMVLISCEHWSVNICTLCITTVISWCSFQSPGLLVLLKMVWAYWNMRHFASVFIYWLIDWQLGSGPYSPDAPRPDGPFVPHFDSREPCYLAKVQDGPQPYIFNIFWLQEKAVQIHMSEWSQGFTLTKDMGWGFFFCSTPPTQWTIWESH